MQISPQTIAQEITVPSDDEAAKGIRDQVGSMLALADDMLSVGLDRASDKIRRSCALILENVDRLSCPKSDG